MLDEDSFTSWDQPVALSGLDHQYVGDLAAAREWSGVDEAVVTGRGAIHGHEVALVVGEFASLGGTIGGPLPTGSSRQCSGQPGSDFR